MHEVSAAPGSQGKMQWSLAEAIGSVRVGRVPEQQLHDFRVASPHSVVQGGVAFGIGPPRAGLRTRPQEKLDHLTPICASQKDRTTCCELQRKLETAVEAEASRVRI